MYKRAVAVSTHDSNPLPGGTADALYVGGAGAVTCKLIGQAADSVFAAVPAGTTIQISASHVRATGTAATSIVALYTNPA